MIWALTLFIITIDTYIESLTGKNMLGYGELYGDRIVSFFKDEPIVGGYINAFYLIIIGYFFSLSHKFSGNYRYFILLVILFFLWAIFLSGERSNAIKAIFGFLIFYFINDQFKIKEKLISILLMLTLIGTLINSSDYTKTRYKAELVDPLIKAYQSEDKKKYQKLSEETSFLALYLQLYNSGFSVFKDYPFFGVGNKNYRHVTCVKNKNPNYICTTHPHQFYIEFLAEHGLIGTFILLIILFNLVFSKLKLIFQSKNYIQISCFVFLLSSLIPLLPSGAFFADYNLTIFWINLSLMYSVNIKTNIFSKD
jgi:O-antigen ligase